MFAKSFCPYSQRTKDALRQSNVQFQAVDLDKRGDGAQLQDRLKVSLTWPFPGMLSMPIRLFCTVSLDGEPFVQQSDR